jgi:hypothetical protein
MKASTSCLAIIAALCAAPGVAAAATQPAESACDALQSLDLSRLPEAPTQMIGAKSVPARSGLPAHCLVRGVVEPSVGFELRLPANWNGKFFASGSGNWGGTFQPGACDVALKRGYACILTDSGHKSPTWDVERTDAKWAYNNLMAEVDWGGRATHVSTLAGKAITQAFYGKVPAKSYFMGCSYGGHQSLAMVQRFPYDFDGVVGGGAPNNIGELMEQNAWAMTVAFDDKRLSRFSEADIRVLHNDVLARCDLDDGIKDGLISNPLACKTDPQALVCKSGQTAECISQEAADRAKKMYAGPSNSKGKALTAGGWTAGSEVDWRMIYKADNTGLIQLAPNYFRYMGRLPDNGPDWNVGDYDFDADHDRNDVMETLYSASNPDLRRFKANGGKYINYVGLNDLGTTPGKNVDYYEVTQRTMGGPAQTRDFFRMFMIPGVRHCRGGVGASLVDFFPYIEAWVEQGQAPEVIVGAHPDEKGAITFKRPIYAYPQYAKYKGKGDTNDPANYSPVTPR